jgi:hypothetical protein
LKSLKQTLNYYENGCTVHVTCTFLRVNTAKNTLLDTADGRNKISAHAHAHAIVSVRL